MGAGRSARGRCRRGPEGGIALALARGGLLCFALSVPACTGCGDEGGRGGFASLSTDAGADEQARLDPEAAAPLSACEAARARGLALGCEYLVFPVPDGSSSNEGCTAVLLSNPTDSPARIEVSRDGQVLDLKDAARMVSTTLTVDPGYVPLEDATLPPGASAAIALVQGELAQFPLTEDLGECPMRALVDESHRGAHDVSDVLAFRIRATMPVFATYFSPYVYGWTWWAPLSSTALRSVGSWDAHNVDVGVFEPGRPLVQHRRNGDAIYDDMAAFLAIGSARDARVTVEGRAQPVDVPAGHVIRLRRDDLLIGSAVTSDAPVAVFVGSRLSFLPYDTGASNPILSQVPPPRAWGSEYAAVRYPDRYDEVPDVAIYRILAEQGGTKLTYEPARPEGAPESLDAGELGVFMTGASFVVRTQDDAHRIYASVAMTGYEQIQPAGEAARGIAGRGGPELVGLVPRSEFAHRFAFMTEHLYPDVHLVLVRAKDAAGFHDVTLGCAGTVTGWTPLGSGNAYETTTVTLSKGKFEPQVYPGGTCHTGPHTMQSEGLFTGYVWGWGHDGAIDLEPPRDGGIASFGFALYGLTRDDALGAAR